MDFKLVLFVILFTLVSCTSTAPKGVNYAPDKFERIIFGDSLQRVKDEFGPGEEEVEPFTVKKFLVLTYYKNKNVPDNFFYFEPKSKKVVSKGKWIDEEKESDLNYLLEEKFKGFSFKKFRPCHMRGNDDFLFLSFTREVYFQSTNGKSNLLIYANQDYLNWIVEKLYLDCPNLQPKK